MSGLHEEDCLGCLDDDWAGCFAASGVEKESGGDHPDGSDGELSLVEPDVVDVGGGHDAADEAEEGDGDAEASGDPTAGLPCASKDVEVGEEATDEGERDDLLISDTHGVA